MFSHAHQVEQDNAYSNEESPELRTACPEDLITYKHGEVREPPVATEENNIHFSLLTPPSPRFLVYL